MIAPGDIAPCQDSSRELYVAVLSNSIHLAANTGRVVACPFIPGKSPTMQWRWSCPSANPKALFSRAGAVAAKFGARRTDRQHRASRPHRGGIDCDRADFVDRRPTSGVLRRAQWAAVRSAPAPATRTGFVVPLLFSIGHSATLRTSILQVGPCARASRSSIVSRVASKTSASAT